MDVIVKSCNRPYYLDRCLHSIMTFAKGVSRIVLLDDGSSPEHLNKISCRFPDVSIYRSKDHEKKYLGIREHVEGSHIYSNKSIPSQFWRDHVAKASDYFLLLEEDAWLCEPVDLTALEEAMRDLSIASTKLHWGNCNRMLGTVCGSGYEEVELIAPLLPIRSAGLVAPLLMNTMRIRSVMTRLQLLERSWLVPYYALYTVTSAVFMRDWWLTIWEEAPNYVKEEKQLLNALRYFSRNKYTRYAKAINEKVRTSYITSSVNSFMPATFDMIKLNHNLSIAWYLEKLDPLNNFPFDFEPAFLQLFMGSPSERYSYELWQDWIHAFKYQFESIGVFTGPLQKTVAEEHKHLGQ